jgi:hypothetical protein
MSLKRKWKKKKKKCVAWNRHLTVRPARKATATSPNSAGPIKISRDVVVFTTACMINHVLPWKCTSMKTCMPLASATSPRGLLSALTCQWTLRILWMIRTVEWRASSKPYAQRMMRRRKTGNLWMTPTAVNSITPL